MTDPAPHEDPNRALAEAREMQAAGKQKDAERLYRRATALAPENVEILFAYAAFRRECGDAAQAATLLERVVAMVPDAVNG